MTFWPLHLSLNDVTLPLQAPLKLRVPAHIQVQHEAGERMSLLQCRMATEESSELEVKKLSKGRRTERQVSQSQWKWSSSESASPSEGKIRTRPFPKITPVRCRSDVLNCSRTLPRGRRHLVHGFPMAVSASLYPLLLSLV